MKVRLIAPVAALCLSALLPLRSSAQSTGTLLVLSKHDHTLSIVDPATLKVVAKMPAGNDPHEVIASTDGTTAYISNYGFGRFNTLTEVDLVAHRTLGTIDLGPLGGPHGLAFAGGKVWFTSEVAKAIGRYDPTTRKVDWILGTGQNRIHMLYVSPDQQTLIAINVNSGTVSIIERQSMPSPSGTRTDWNETVVRVGNGSEGFDVSPDHKQAWVANAKDATISVIDLAAKKVVATLNTNTRGANRLKFMPDGKHVLVSSGPELVILDAATRQVIKRIPIGHGSGGILVEPGGGRAFVACGPDNYVAVIDLSAMTVSGHIQAGGEPDGMAWAIRPGVR